MLSFVLGLLLSPSHSQKPKRIAAVMEATKMY